jgi:DNA-binding GntR family transcriptional regulator
MTGPATFFPLAPPIHRTAQAAVAERLRAEILTGALRPGARLLQSAVAVRMGTSTTPVREALRELAVEGLLDVDAHRGVIVHEPTAEELEEVYAIRLLLEPASIAKTAQAITEHDLRRAEEILERMEREPDPGSWAWLNREFHGLLAEASRSPLLSQTLANLRNRSALYVALCLQGNPRRLATGNQEHRRLLEACRAGDADGAVDTVRTHLESTLSLAVDYLSEKPAE